MDKNSSIILGIVILLVVTGGLYLSMSNKDEAMMKKAEMEQKAMQDKKMAEEKMMAEKDTITEDATKSEEMMKKEDTNAMDKKVETSGAIMKGSYEAYSPEKIAMAEKGDVVIFFHASWCPSCRALNGDIESNMSTIPAGVTILKADYDKETDLKKKYGVTSQHTLVQVDKDGNLIKKWSGGGKLTNLLSQIQ